MSMTDSNTGTDGPMTAPSAFDASARLPRHHAPHSYARSYEVIMTVTIESTLPVAHGAEAQQVADELARDAMNEWPASTVAEVHSVNEIVTPDDHMQVTA